MFLAVSISSDAFLVEQRVILTIKDEEHSVRHFQLNEVDNFCVDWVLSRSNFLFTKII